MRVRGGILKEIRLQSEVRVHTGESLCLTHFKTISAISTCCLKDPPLGGGGRGKEGGVGVVGSTLGPRSFKLA